MVVRQALAGESRADIEPLGFTRKPDTAKEPLKARPWHLSPERLACPLGLGWVGLGSQIQRSFAAQLI